MPSPEHAIDVIHPPVSDEPVGFLNSCCAAPPRLCLAQISSTGLLFIVGIAISNRTACIARASRIDGGHASEYLPPQSDRIPSISVSTATMPLWRQSPCISGESHSLISLLAAAITVPLTEYFPSSQLGIPALTSPFVLASWIVILIGQIEIVFMKEQKAV